MTPIRPQSETPGKGVALSRMAMLLSAGLVIARATIVQTLRDPELVVPGSTAVPRTAGPAAGLIFDLLFCVPALLILLRRVIDPDFRLRFRVSHALFFALAIVSAASSFWSNDKFATVVTSAHFLAAAVLFWSMTQLVRSWLDVRIVAGICFGILLIYAAQGLIYRYVDLPDNIRYWEEHRDDELARRGWQADSFIATQFERKIRSGELTGFNTSANTFAAMIVFLGTIAAGSAVQRIVDHDESGWPGAIVIAMGIAGYILYFTGCRAAVFTPLLAAGMIAFAPTMARRRKPLYIACAITTILGTIALVAQGLYHGNLLDASLTNRWRYWTGAMQILRNHPIFGIGWSNFGEYYLGVRLPVATEEVKDPHNLLVRAMVELGIVGGALMIAWLAKFSWELTEPTIPTEKASKRISATRTILTIGAAGILLNILASVDFGLESTERGWFVLLEIFKRLLFLGLLHLGMALILLRSSKDPELDDRPSPWLLRAMIAGIAVFLVHNLIDFSLFEPGPLCVFALAGGAVLGARSNPTSTTCLSRVSAMTLTAIATLVCMGAALSIVAPVVIAEQTAHEGDSQVRSGNPETGAIALRDAFEMLWIPNPDYAYRAAVAMQYAGMSADQTRAMLDAAVAADRMSALYPRARANFLMRQASPDATQVIQDYERILKLDPNDVSAHSDFADALNRLGQPQRAVEEYRKALRLNDLLPPTELKRLPPAVVIEIEQKAGLRNPTTTTSPP